MVDYLMEMMEAGEFQKALRLAQQQLITGDHTPVEMAKLNLVICRCRLGFGDPYRALPSGLMAVKLARDTKQWDLLGRILLNVGNAFVATRQYDKALENFYEYLEKLPFYTTANRFEGAVWKNIGIAHQYKLESKRAVDAFNRARLWFGERQLERSLYACTHDLVNTYLQMHETNPKSSLDPVLFLLREEKEVVRRNPADSYYKAVHLLDKASAYYHERRYGRAMVSAMQALEVRKGDLRHAFYCHMVLHRCTRDLGNLKDALGYVIAARSVATEGRLFELEYIASQALADTVRMRGSNEAVRELNAQYQAMGVDLSRYLSPELLKQPN